MPVLFEWDGVRGKNLSGCALLYLYCIYAHLEVSMNIVSTNQIRDKLKSHAEQIVTDHLSLKVTRRAGVDLCVVPTVIADDLSRQYESVELGCIDEVVDSFYVIVNERNLSNPAINRIIETTRDWFSSH